MIKDYIGLPYENRGRGIKGYDCYGMAILFYKEEFGLDIPDYTSSYDLSNNKIAVNNAITINSNKDRWQKVEVPSYGTLIFFRIRGYVSHIGIYINDNEFIHCYPNRETTIERLDSLLWSNSISHYLNWR